MGFQNDEPVKLDEDAYDGKGGSESTKAKKRNTIFENQKVAKAGKQASRQGQWRKDWMNKVKGKEEITGTAQSKKVAPEPSLKQQQQQRKKKKATKKRTTGDGDEDDEEESSNVSSGDGSPSLVFLLSSPPPLS